MKKLDILLNIIKDCIFPNYCLGCGEEGEVICKKCLEDIDWNGVFFCPICHKINQDGSCCFLCQKDSSLDIHVALCKYEEPRLIGKLIHEFKYSYIESINDIFAEKIKEFAFNNQFADLDLVVPVPLYKRRYIERGFNQAELIADSLSKILKIELSDCLSRIRNTVQQAKLDREGRIFNVRKAFIVKKDLSDFLVGKNILLVDDVFTTGSTMQECAKELKVVGVKKIIGFSVGRG